MRIISVCNATAMVVLGFAAVAAGQTLSAGIKVHQEFMSPLTSTSGLTLAGPAAAIGSFTETGTRFSGGPTVELLIPKGFAVSFEASRYPLSYENQWVANSPSTFMRTTFKSNTAGRAWEFPFVLKKYIGTGSNMSSYVEAGFVERHTSATETFQSTTEYTVCFVQPCGPTITTGSRSPQELSNRWTSGVVFGGGVDLRYRRFHFAPGLRYTRWLQQSFTTTNNALQSNSNSVGVVLGVRIIAIKAKPGS